MSTKHDPVHDALAWFIIEDETNSGGDDEESNRYWLAGRRLAKQFFSSELELAHAHTRHTQRMASLDHWPKEMDDLPESNSSHEAIETAARIKHWASIP
jgi:hypothetical protein